MSVRKVLIAILAATVISANMHAQGFLKASGQKIVNAQGENVLLRGVGLGGWMLQEGYMLGLKDSAQQHVIRMRLERLLSKQQVDEFYDVWLQNHTTKADIDSLKAWGFNSVRLPMHYNLFTLPVDKEPVAGENTWLTKGFELTDSLLAWCSVNKMYLVLDMHAAPGGQGNDVNISDRDASKPSLWQSDADKQKMIALWTKIAARYAKEEWIGAYDIINEPNYGFDDPVNDKNGTKEKHNIPLKQLMVDITTAIRTVDKNHLVIIEGNAWGNNYNGILNDGLWDKNMALSFHKYWNYNDEASIKNIVDYRLKYNVPVWLGESGENSNVWFTQAIALLEKNNIGWSWWPLKKLGSSNPLQVKPNLNYDRLAKFLNGESTEAPKESDVYSGLLEMATYTNIKSNIIHYDVIDAMIRQPHDATAKPFKKFSASNGAIINAVDYDLGPNGVAYFDKDTANYWVVGKPGAGNRGGVYRNDGVDIFRDSSEYNAFYVGSIESGEWLQYTIPAATATNLNVQITVAALKPGGSITIKNNGKIVAAAISVPLAGSKAGWQTVMVKNVPFQRGNNVVQLLFSKGGFNVKRMALVK